MTYLHIGQYSLQPWMGQDMLHQYYCIFCKRRTDANADGKRETRGRQGMHTRSTSARTPARSSRRASAYSKRAPCDARSSPSRPPIQPDLPKTRKTCTWDRQNLSRELDLEHCVHRRSSTDKLRIIYRARQCGQKRLDDKGSASQAVKLEKGVQSWARTGSCLCPLGNAMMCLL